MRFIERNLGYAFGSTTIKPVQSKKAESDEIPSFTTKIELNNFLGLMNVYSYFFDKLHVEMKPLHNLLCIKVQIHWVVELGLLLQQIRKTITKDVTLALPTLNHRLFLL